MDGASPQFGKGRDWQVISFPILENEYKLDIKIQK